MSKKLTLPEQIQAGMDAKGWTQADLAEAVGITQSAVSYILNGRDSRWSTVCAIAKALGIKITT